MPVVVITKVHRKIGATREAEDGGRLENSNSFESLCVHLPPIRRDWCLLADVYICVFHLIRVNVRFWCRIFRELCASTHSLILSYSNRLVHKLWLQCNAFNMSICLSVCLFDCTANWTESKYNGSKTDFYLSGISSIRRRWIHLCGSGLSQENKGLDQPDSI